jgi:hypothetical protein
MCGTRTTCTVTAARIPDGTRLMMADWTSLRYAVADVEGNGQQPPDLVELAVLPITDGVIGEPVSWLVKPPRPITYFATSIHGISGNDVASAPAFADIEHEVRRALADRALVRPAVRTERRSCLAAGGPVGELESKIDRDLPEEGSAVVASLARWP